MQRMVKRIFISTGEVSGDLQGSLLVAALRRQANLRGLDLEILALGGDRMAAEGAKLLGHTSAIGSIGVVESIGYAWPTWQIQQRAKQFLRQNPPDLAVLIDYMGPNIALGNYLHQTYPDLPIFYYIAPQEWVWSANSKSTRQIIGFANEILAIFPGEARYYQAQGANVTWVGHPLVDTLTQIPGRDEARAKLGIGPEELAIALLPASREQELKYLLPVLFEAAQRIQAQLPNVHYWIPVALEQYRLRLEQAIQDYGLRATLLSEQEGQIPSPKASSIPSPTQWAIAAADLAITKSGTANLEIALQNVPQVVVYRFSAVTAWVARNILKLSIPFVSPPNLVEMEAIVPELLQEDMTPERITAEAIALLQTDARQAMLAGYARMRAALGEPGVCDRAATLLLERLTAGSDRD